MSNEQVTHARRVYSLLDLFGELGGLLEVIIVFFGFVLAPWAEFKFEIAMMKKLYMVKTKKGVEDQFERKNTQKESKKAAKMATRIRDENSRKNLQHLHQGHLSASRQVRLFLQNVFGCLPD